MIHQISSNFINFLPIYWAWHYSAQACFTLFPNIAFGKSFLFCGDQGRVCLFWVCTLFCKESLCILWYSTLLIWIIWQLPNTSHEVFCNMGLKTHYKSPCNWIKSPVSSMTSSEEGQPPSNEPEKWQDTHPLSPIRFALKVFAKTENVNLDTQKVENLVIDVNSLNWNVVFTSINNRRSIKVLRN